MHPSLRVQWTAVAKEYSSTFRPLAVRIGRHDRSNFELLWLLSDFAELCVTYCSLLLLGHGFHDAGLRRTLFRDPLTHDLLGRPTFGKWYRFLYRALGRIDEDRIEVPFPGLLDIRDGDALATVDEIITRRNALAHGRPERFDVTPEDVDELCEAVLKITYPFRPVCTCQLLHSTSGGLCFHPPTPSGDGAVELDPFVIGIEGSDGPLFYESLERKDAIFRSQDPTHAGCHRDPELGIAIKRYLQQGRTGESDDPSIERTQVRAPFERSRLLVDRFRGRADESEYGTEFFLRELPPFSGRPTLFKQLSEVLRKTAAPLAYHLYGRPGMGKRRFLAELLQDLQQQDHLVVPLIALDLDSGCLENAWNRALDVEGGLRELTEVAKRTSSAARVVLAVDDISALLADASRRDELLAVLRDQHNIKDLHLLLLSDSTEPLEYAWAGRPSFIQIPFPVMEESGREQFYGRVIKKTDHGPLSTWHSLPRAAKRIAGVPLDLVRLCRRFRHRQVPESLSVEEDLREPWNTDMEEMWNDGVVGDPHKYEVARAIAQSMIRIGRRQVPSVVIPEWIREDPDRHRAYRILKTLGILAETTSAWNDEITIAIQFTTYYWLVRALQLVVALWVDTADDSDAIDGGLSAEGLSQVLAACDSFSPICDAFSLWAADRPEQRLEFAFEKLMRHDARTLSRIVESFIVRAYPFPDIFDRLLSIALASDREMVLRGCGAAAQQLVRSGDEEAVTEGIQLYSRLIDVCRRQQLETLEATLLNEFGVHGINSTAVRRQREYFELARQKAERLGVQNLAAIARNNIAAVDLETAESLQHSAPDLAKVNAEQIIRLLEDARSREVNYENWAQVRTSLQYLARAYRIVGGDDGGAAQRRCCERLRDICQQFGTAVDVAVASSQCAGCLAEQGDFPKALAMHEEAIGWMAAAGDLFGLAQCLMDRARTLKLHGGTDKPESQRQFKRLESSLNQLKLALEKLEDAPDCEQKRSLLADIWYEMASVLQQFGEVSEASLCYAKSLQYRGTRESPDTA